MNIFITIGIILCIIVIALIMAMCIQVKRAEKNFYEYQKEYEIKDECNPRS